MKQTVLNPESAWREGNGDYLPGDTGGGERKKERMGRKGVNVRIGGL